MTSDSKPYVRAVLDMYARTPNTTPPRTSDRRLAADLYDRSVPLATIEAALLLATARRLSRSPDLPVLPTIRSLAYFLPVIEEIRRHPLPSHYVDYLRHKISASASR
jgi:hypothetical protein